MTRLRHPAALLALVLLAVACGSDTELQDEVGSLRDQLSLLDERLATLEAAPETTTTITATTTTTVPATTTSTPPPPTTTSVQGDLTRVAVEFFLASESLCRAHANQVGNSPPDPERYQHVEAIEMLDADRVLLRDGLDYELIVDFGSEPATIYSSEGPEAVLPHDLSFGCPPDLYLGSAAS